MKTSIARDYQLQRRICERLYWYLLTGRIVIDLVHIDATSNLIIPIGTTFTVQRFEAFRALAQVGKQDGGLMIGQVFFFEFVDAIVLQLCKTQVFVTRRLRTMPSMCKVLSNVVGIRLWRFFCAETCLAHDILEGRVKTEAIKQAMGEQDHGLKITQLGRNQKPMDITRTDLVEEFMNSVQRIEKAFG